MGIAARPGPASGALNQPPPLAGYNLFAQNRPLVEALEREGAGWAVERATVARRAARGRAASSGRGSRTRTRRSSARTTASATASTRSSSIPPGTRCCATSVEHGAHALSWREPRDGRAGRARGAVLPRGAGRGRPHVPALDDARGRAGAARAARARRRVGAAAHVARVRPRPRAGRRQARRALRHGHDREAGRLRRPRQHHDRAAASAAASTSSRDTSGSARRRCATRFSCSRRRRTGCRASCSRACSPTARATASGSSA